MGPGGTGASDFLAVYLQNGSVVLHFNFGGGDSQFTIRVQTSAKYSDGLEHSLIITRMQNQASLTVDSEVISAVAAGMIVCLFVFANRYKCTQIHKYTNTSSAAKCCYTVYIYDETLQG